MKDGLQLLGVPFCIQIKLGNLIIIFAFKDFLCKYFASGINHIKAASNKTYVFTKLIKILIENR